MAISKTLNVRLPQELQKELLSLSKQEHVPISTLVRDSIKEFLTIRKFKRLNKQASYYARRAGYMTEEDVLNIPS